MSKITLSFTPDAELWNHISMFMDTHRAQMTPEQALGVVTTLMRAAAAVWKNGRQNSETFVEMAGQIFEKTKSKDAS